MKRRTASEKIGLFVESTHKRATPPQVVHQVARAFVDTFGVAVAGSGEPASRIIRDHATEEGFVGPSSIWATGERVRQEDAALVNATMCHVLDYDDVSVAQRGHPSAVLLPALLAVGEAVGATGGQISAAYVAGFEVMTKVAEAMAFDDSRRGSHPLSPIGVIGGTVACASLLGLDAERTASAVGISVAHTPGIRRCHGTMCKSLQLANSAYAAIRSARLAAAGFTATEDSLDGHPEFVGVYGKGGDLHSCLDSLGTTPPDLLRTGLDVKQYPCSYATHRAAQGVLDLLSERPFHPHEVERIRVAVQPGGLSTLVHRRPWTGLEGKSSLEYVVAAAILDAALHLESFTDEAVQRPAAQALLRKVESFEEGGRTSHNWAEVEVGLRSGERRAIRVEALRGSAELPLTDSQLEAKLRSCVASSRLEMDLDRFVSAVWDWQDRSVRAICEVAGDSKRADRHRSQGKTQD